MSSKKKNWVSYGGMGAQMVIYILVFYFVGKYACKTFDWNQRIGVPIFTLLGVIAAMYYVIKNVMKNEK